MLEGSPPVKGGAEFQFEIRARAEAPRPFFRSTPGFLIIVHQASSAVGASAERSTALIFFLSCLPQASSMGGASDMGSMLRHTISHSTVSSLRFKASYLRDTSQDVLQS